MYQTFWTLLAAACICAMPQTAAAGQAGGQSEKLSCNVVIGQPKPGENVGPTGQVVGRATVPDGTYVWVLARKEDINGWWPQANGAVQIRSDTTFKAFVTYGTDGDKGLFEVAVAVVDYDVNQSLNRWFDRANETGNYPPVRFPNVHQGCPVTRVIVARQ